MSRPVTSPAQARLHADIKRLLSTLMQRDIADPRLFSVCITRTESLHGGQSVRIWVHKPDVSDTDVCIDRLNHLASHFSHELCRAMPKRRLPKLLFCWDKSIEDGGDMVQLLHSLEEK
ncbi:MAG: ribosome-binding factor A [Mariprofundaceae bacterium]|nr:ribosome-binding factor A [Mariprofundaceae bacterium]